MTFLRQSRLALPTGVELDVIQSGDPRGAPLLLLHGLSDSAASMRPLMDRLPRQLHAIAVTQRGHGHSSKPCAPYTVDAFAADAAAVLERLGGRPAVVLGHSMGSVVAQRLARLHPERVSGLILEGAFPGLKGNGAVEALYEGEIAGLTDPVDPAFIRGFQESTLAKPVPPAFLDAVCADSAKLPARVWKAILRELMVVDTTSDLAAIRVPALLLWGDQDAFCTRADQARLEAGLRDATLAIFRGTGHAPHWEDPDLCAARVGAFVLRRNVRAAA